MMALLISRASAQVTSFSNKNYSGSYSCRDASFDDFFTAVFQYTPDGGGSYTSGTLVATLNGFVAFDTSPPAAQFCTYFLQTAASAYSIDTTGLGFETLTWLPSVANNANCPGTFVNQTQIALRNLTSSNGATSRAEFSDDNFLDLDAPGHGTCLGGVTAAPPPFSASNYANRYVCNVSDDANGTTGVMRINPNGAGAYKSGDLQLAYDGVVFPFDPTVPPKDNFCEYTLVSAASGYTVSANGLGTEVLSWKSAPGNNADCSPSFVMSDEIALHINANGKVHVQITSGNLNDDDEPGYGSCFK
jgi:hypothetical protein